MPGPSGVNPRLHVNEPSSNGKVGITQDNVKTIIKTFAEDSSQNYSDIYKWVGGFVGTTLASVIVGLVALCCKKKRSSPDDAAIPLALL